MDGEEDGENLRQTLLSTKPDTGLDLPTLRS